MNTRRFIIALAMLAIMLPCAAQEGNRHKKDGPRHREITEMVGDLSQTQKKKLDAITDASKERVGLLRAQQKAVRDSIAVYMKLDGDHSAVLFPLFDREARLQCEISREMYTTKVRVDEVLTPEQRKQLRQSTTQKHREKPQKKSKK